MNTSTKTNIPIPTNTYISTSTYTSTMTLVPSMQGRVIISINDIFGNGVKDIDVILNNDEVYETDEYSMAYIFYNIRKEFDINFKKDGYLFTPSFYHGKFNYDNKNDGCNKVLINLNQLKQNVKKMNKFSNIIKNNNTMLANKIIQRLTTY